MKSNQVIEINSAFRKGRASSLEADIAELLEQGCNKVSVSKEAVEDFLGVEEGDEAIMDWQQSERDRGFPSDYDDDKMAFVFRPPVPLSLEGN